MNSKANYEIEDLSLIQYDADRLGPLFAVSDEGSAGTLVVKAAYASAKAKAMSPITAAKLGVALDGERMTSAGEVPIGPIEYEQLSDAAAGKLFLTTNVGVRVNARLSQQLPEFPLTEKSQSDPKFFENILATFAPFVQTPDGHPRPLTIRLSIDPKAPVKSLKAIAAKIEGARKENKIGKAELHQVTVLIAFENMITGDDQIQLIEGIMDLTKEAGFPELALDAELRETARRHLGVQSLLNILDPDHLRRLLKSAQQRGLRLTYRYHLDVESAARTIWTGLHTARANGFSAGKYGLVPMTLEEQATTIEMITRWTTGWSAVPAFYVDTPLLTQNEVFDVNQAKDAAKIWLKTARGAGVKVVLFDCPDRVSPRRLLRQPDVPNDIGILSLADVDEILSYAKDLGVSILWSGGITSRQAFELAQRRVFGIFTTSSTAAKIAVTAEFEDDPRLASENEPTDLGVRRIHAVIQGGFLSTALKDRHPEVSGSLKVLTDRVIGADQDLAKASKELANLNKELLRGWQLHGESNSLQGETIVKDSLNPVPPDAVRVFRGKKRGSLDRRSFIDKLGTVFMPMTVQMQRLYGLMAYLPAVLPEKKADSLPDEVALVFYRTQQSYQEAKRCIGGRAYSELHQLVFEMPQSPSSFPELFTSKVEVGKAYHIFSKSVDWQDGSARVWVGTRKSNVTPEKFLSAVGSVARSVRETPGGVDAVILTVSNDWLVWWEHSSEGSLESKSRFGEIADEVFAPLARRVQTPTNLLHPYLGVGLNMNGDFVNFQFQPNVTNP
jgi:hypothetical protein